MVNRFSGYAWKCVCGNVEYGENSPEFCLHCNASDSFEKEKDYEDNRDLAESLE